MPSKSASQHRFMAMAQDPEGRKKLEAEGMKVPPVTVARDFLHADRMKRLKKAVLKGMRRTNG